MADASYRCVYGDECPQRRLRERRVVESLDKFQKETVEKYDLCDGTLLNKVITVERNASNGNPWETTRIEEKWRSEGDSPSSKTRFSLKSLPLVRRESAVFQCSRAPQEGLPPKQPCYIDPRPKECADILKKEVELQELELCMPRREFPTCDYHPPLDAPESTHISEKTLSIYDSFNSKKSCEKVRDTPICAPRRFSSLRVDERCLNNLRSESPSLPKPMERLCIEDRPFVTRPFPGRHSTASAPGDTPFYSCPGRDRPPFVPEKGSCPDPCPRPTDCLFPASPDPLVRQSMGRQSGRTSSRSSEKHFIRSQSVCGRRRCYRDSPRHTPEPLGDVSRHRKTHFEIPIYSEDGYYDSYCRRPEGNRMGSGTVFQRPRLQEETITRETFERVTTSRKLFSNTLV